MCRTCNSCNNWENWNTHTWSGSTTGFVPVTVSYQVTPEGSFGQWFSNDGNWNGNCWGNCSRNTSNRSCCTCNWN